MTFLGALPARFRRERVLVVGCGDVGQRAARVLGNGRRVRLLALTSNPDNAGALRGQGITPLIGNLDRPADLQRLAGLATRVLHLAPPPSEGQADWQADAMGQVPGEHERIPLPERSAKGFAMKQAMRPCWRATSWPAGRWRAR